MDRFGPARTQTRSVHTAKLGHSSPSSRGFHKTSPAAGWNRPYPSRETPPPVPPPPLLPNLRSILPAPGRVPEGSSPGRKPSSHSSFPSQTRHSLSYSESAGHPDP